MATAIATSSIECIIAKLNERVSDDESRGEIISNIMQIRKDVHRITDQYVDALRTVNEPGVITGELAINRIDEIARIMDDKLCGIMSNSQIDAIGDNINSLRERIRTDITILALDANTNVAKPAHPTVEIAATKNFVQSALHYYAKSNVLVSLIFFSQFPIFRLSLTKLNKIP